MDKLLQHNPEIDEEHDIEYPWSIAAGKIKSKKLEWKKIENIINKKCSNKELREQFFDSILHELIDIKTERFLNVDHDKYDNKEDLLKDLTNIKKNICSVQKHFWHREYHEILNTHIDDQEHNENFSFEDGTNKTSEALKHIECSLQQMKIAAEKAITHYTEQEKLRPSLSTTKKCLKHSLASHIAIELHKIGIRPTQTRNGTFDSVFQLCCDIADQRNFATKPGSLQVIEIAKKYK